MGTKVQSFAHTNWLCKYHIVFTPKYRRKIVFAQLCDSIKEILQSLCKYKGVAILECHLMPDHIHMLVAPPPPGKNHNQQTPEKDNCATHVTAHGLRIKIRTMVRLLPLSGQFNGGGGCAVQRVSAPGGQPGGNTAPRPCRHVMTAQKVWQKVCPKSSPVCHVHRPRARCVSPAAGVMIRLGGAQARHFELSVSARRPLIEEESTRRALFPECWEQAKEFRLNQPGQTSGPERPV